jgi:hypothetical protein
MSLPGHTVQKLNQIMLICFTELYFIVLIMSILFLSLLKNDENIHYKNIMSYFCR